MERGTARFQQGAFGQAGAHWAEAARLYEEEGRVEEQCRAFINLAHAFQQEGQIKKAMSTLQAALNDMEFFFIEVSCGKRKLLANATDRDSGLMNGFGGALFHPVKMREQLIELP